MSPDQPTWLAPDFFGGCRSLRTSCGLTAAGRLSVVTIMEMKDRFQTAYEAGFRAIQEDSGTNHFPAESFQAAAKVEEHRWHWRSERPRLILIAESHVYTSDADLGVTINQDGIAPLLPPGQPLPPPEYVGLVYCLGYGEKKLLLNRHAGLSNRGTWQFWDLFGRIAGTGKQPRSSTGVSLISRLKWKIDTLNRLKELGVWLLDASAHAIYIGNRLRRSPECCQALHRQWWEHYGRHVVADCGDPLVWVIGASAHRYLVGVDGFKSQGFIYQPNARGKIDRERNWNRLLGDITKLRTEDHPASSHGVKANAIMAKHSGDRSTSTWSQSESTD